MSENLSRLLRPQSVAVFGGGWAANVVEQLLKAGFQGDIWPVHPAKSDVHGVRAYRTLDDLPDAPDAAWIGVNRDATVDLVRALRERGAGGAVCFASGFRESADGEDRNAALLKAAGDMPIIGPNCYGALNYLDGATLWPDQHGGKRLGAIPGEVDSGSPVAPGTGGIATKKARGVAIITQSSNIAINMTMQRRGLPIAYALTAGNQAQIGLAEMAAALLEDERVTAIGLHVEGVGDPRAFEALAAKARDRRIPVIAMKVGRSEHARRATVSHTASLAGSDTGSRAFFRRLGIPLIGTIPAFLETLKLLHVHGPLPGRDVLSMSCSGGEASLVADTAQGRGLRFRPYTEAQKAAIADTLNPLVTVANPLDYHTFIWGDETALTETFAAAMAPGFDLSMLVLDFPRADRCSHETWEPAVRSIAEASRRAKARTAVVASIGELLPEDRCEAFMAAGIAPLCGIDEALTAAEAAASVAEAWQREMPPPILPSALRDGEPLTLDEAEGKRRLAEHGVPAPDGRVISEAARAREAANLIGAPMVVKGLGFAHKTEANAVFLNVRDAGEAESLAAGLLTRCERVLIEEMLPVGVEMIVGLSRDPAYGLMLTLGAGGVMAELLEDTATLLLPVTEAELREAVAGLKLAKLLAGWRGKPAADLDSAVTAIMAVGRFAEAHAERLEELDINPLIVSEDGAWAADALIRLRGG